MAFTGDLEHIHIVDIIQLIHTTRKSGIFSVKGSSGESLIIFNNGYIVGATHLNNRIRIGTVLLRMNAITSEDLRNALEIQNNSGKNRKPLIITLIEMGKLKHEDAFKGLKELIEMTLVELIGLTKGIFTFDAEAFAVLPESSYLPDKMEQEIALDAQMVLMDALRIFDEREHDRKSGKHVPSYEEMFPEMILSEGSVKDEGKSTAITAEDLGLDDLERLEKKIPQTFSFKEIFDPVEIHRQKIKEILSDFSDEEQDAIVSFLKESTVSVHKGSARPESQANALVLFSQDKLIKYSVMIIFKNEGILVFDAEKEEELDTVIAQCLFKKILPILVFDNSETSEEGLSEEKIARLHQQIKERYPQVSTIQLTSLLDYTSIMRSFSYGSRAVFPKPLKEPHKEIFIEETIKFLKILKSYIKNFFNEQKNFITTDDKLRKLRDHVLLIRELKKPSDIPLALLHFISEIFDRTITFLVRPTELVGERAIGVNAEKKMGPTPAGKLKIPLTKPSVFSKAVESGQSFYGESDDEVLRKYLFEEIGIPMRPVVILLPIKSHSKTVSIIYGDFGFKEISPVQIDILEIIVNQAGLVLENLLYRKRLTKVSQK
jgi:hypothetical protein